MVMRRLADAVADRYRVERELGAGGMATVYLARDIKHERQVALKVLRPELAAVVGATRFLAEIRTTANLQHPHILSLFDSGEVDGTVFYVMPFVDGESLRDRLAREKQLPIADAVRIATEVADALQHAHARGVIHRDIKPDNILLHGGHALVADFGIALAASATAGTRMTETGMSLGTPHYMSPEQAMGEPVLDARSDVYALGCVMYEMLTGEPPFTGPTAQAIVAKVMTADPVAPALLRKSIPAHVADAVLTALEKLPADRYASAQEFADALRSGNAASQPARRSTGAKPSSATPRRTLVIGALVGLGALVAAAAVGRLTARAGDAAPLTTRMLLRFPESQRFVSTRNVGLAASPDGSTLAYVGPGANVRSQLWLRRWERLQAQRLPQTPDESCCMTFSPSGDTVAYLSNPRQLTIMPLNGGLPTVLPDVGLGGVSDGWGGLDWGADGALYAPGLSGLLRIDPRTGKARTVVPLDSARGDFGLLWPQLLPGGRTAIVTVTNRRSPFDATQASIGIADLETGRVQIIQQGLRALYAPTGHLIVVRPDGVLWGVPFDASTGRTSGTARELGDTVAVRRAGNSTPGIANLVLDARGTLTYVSAASGAFNTVWVDRAGVWKSIDAEQSRATVDGVALSPDGNMLALGFAGEDRQIHLWLKPVGAGAATRFTFDGSLNDLPRWRPRSTFITFLSNRGARGVETRAVFERDASGQGVLRKLELGETRNIGEYAWAPDGQRLVIRTDNQAEGSGDILTVRPGIDSVARALVATPAEELSPAVSPDGHWFAYTSNESGRREVYVRSFPEPTDARFQVSTAGGTTPAWSANGRELFFIDASQHMVAVPVIPGETFRSGTARALFSTTDYFDNAFRRQFEPSADGQRFVMNRQMVNSEFGIVVVTNFLEDLKRRMAAR
ncbi:MAG: protein kinase [Gemmatimonadota bacterium]